MVVPVLITSCHVSPNPNSGPVMTHTKITNTAKPKADGLPAARAVHFAQRVNQDLDLVGRMLWLSGFSAR